MSNALQSVGKPNDLISFDAGKIDLIKRTLAKGATDDELEMFLHQCRRTGLDPMAKQIYFRKQKTKNGDQMTIITGIDGYRLIADRTGKYAGNDDPVFDNEENVNRASVTVYKMIGGVRCPYTASARWHQYYPGDSQGFMWKKMPHLMLGKCAEALALRKAFPAELSGLYVKEEMDQAQAAGDVDEAPRAVQALPEPERYTATAIQKRELMDHASKLGITTREDLTALSAACMGIELQDLRAAITEWAVDRKVLAAKR